MSSYEVPLGPAAVDITGIRAGDANQIAFTLTTPSGAPMNLTGYTVKAQARQTPVAEEAITAVVQIIDAAKGKLVLSWPGAAVTTMLDGKSTWKGVWDLQIGSPPNDPVTLAAGKFSAVMDVTRP